MGGWVSGWMGGWMGGLLTRLQDVHVFSESRRPSGVRLRECGCLYEACAHIWWRHVGARQTWMYLYHHRNLSDSVREDDHAHEHQEEAHQPLCVQYLYHGGSERNRTYTKRILARHPRPTSPSPSLLTLPHPHRVYVSVADCGHRHGCEVQGRHIHIQLHSG